MDFSKKRRLFLQLSGTQISYSTYIKRFSPWKISQRQKPRQAREIGGQKPKTCYFQYRSPSTTSQLALKRAVLSVLWHLGHGSPAIGHRRAGLGKTASLSSTIYIVTKIIATPVGSYLILNPRKHEAPANHRFVGIYHLMLWPDPPTALSTLSMLPFLGSKSKKCQLLKCKEKVGFQLHPRDF